MFLPGETFLQRRARAGSRADRTGRQRARILRTPDNADRAAARGRLRLAPGIGRGERATDSAISARNSTSASRHGRAPRGLASSLNRSVGAFNRTLGAIQERVLPSVRKFKELGIASKKEIKEFEPIHTVPREFPVNDSGISIGFHAGPKKN